jgi:RHS repeat-associated protein
MYNPSGTLQSVTDPKNQTISFEYNASDERTKMIYPGNSYQSWVYDNAHNLASRRTVNNQTQTFTYDNRNRKTGMSWSNGADLASFTYYDDGKLWTATNLNATVTRAYDAAGRLRQDQQDISGFGTKNITYPLYDDDGRLKQIQLPGVYDYTFGYDAIGRFETISPTGGSVAFRYYYDRASNEIQRRSNVGSATIDQIYGRDSLNRMASRFLKKNNQSPAFSQEVYTYDRMNRLSQTVREDGKKDIFGFYWNGELCWVQYGVQQDAPIQEGADPDLDTTDNVDPYANYQPPDVPEAEPAPPVETGNGGQGSFNPPDSAQYDRWVGYLLDKAGNRNVVADSGSGNAYYNVNNLNQYTSAAGSSVINGNNHEIGSYSGVTYSYINDERLKQVTSGTNNYYLSYDALGRCVKRTLNSVTTYYVYDGEKPILEYKSNDLTHPAKNVYGKGIDEILMRTDPTVNSGNAFYYGQDHEGSVTHLLNASGNKIETYRYDAFGAPTFYNGSGTQIASTAYNNRFLFTGREYGATYQKTYTAAFTFYEYRARAYHPGLGRFMSEDPKLFDAGDYNLFRYCHNDPVDFTDPMGLDWAGPSPMSSMERLWAMTKWFDRSNTLQGNFVWSALNAERDLTMGQVRVGQRMSVERAIPINGQRDPLLDRGTEDRLATLRQPVRDMARSLIYHSRVELRLDVRIVPQGAFRSYAEQNDLYARGISPARGGQSFHNFGIAFDIGLFEGRRYIEDGPGYTTAGHLGERLGLEWGGSWSPRRQDPPHFQYLGGQTMSQIRARFEQGLSPIPGY